MVNHVCMHFGDKKLFRMVHGLKEHDKHVAHKKTYEINFFTSMSMYI